MILGIEDLHLKCCSFPELVELEFTTLGTDLNDTLSELVVPKLKCFKFVLSSSSMIRFGQVIKDAMPHLEELHVTLYDRSMHPGHLTEEILLGCTELKTISISYDEYEFGYGNENELIKDYYILTLVKHLPKLTNLVTKLQFDVLNFDTMRELRSFLRENNRKLLLNYEVLN